MELQPTEQLPEEADIDRLLKIFNALYEHAAQLLLPKKLQWFYWLKDAPNPGAKYQRMVFYLTNSLSSNILWSLFFLAWVYVVLFPPETTNATMSDSRWLGNVFLFLAFVGAGLAYSRVLIFLRRDNRYPKNIRQLIVGLIILISMLGTVWIANRTSADNLSLWSTFWGIIALPALTHLTILITQSLVIGGYWLITYAFYHSPDSGEQIRHLMLNPVPIGNQEWYFASMTEDERWLLEKWSAANRDNIVQRFWPTVIFFAAIGVLADALMNLESVQTALDTGIIWLGSSWGSLSSQPLLAVSTAFLLLVVGTFVAGLFASAMLNLFRALIVRGFIVEACAWVEYNDRMKKPLSPGTPPTPTPNSHDSRIARIMRWIKNWF